MRAKLFLSWACGLILLCGITRGAERPPNVVLIMTDDQGFGDLGFTGNDKIKTPHLDAFAKSALYLDQFHVSPVCTPTRASLMTGRYNYRTRAIDTYLGRAMMDPAELTLAEMLRDHGYKTGIYGKWHLGDNYPLRAMDQGFEESLVHPGGGLMQPASPPQNHYTDPILWRQGKPEKQKGYCSDIYTTAAIEFLTRQKQNPFFIYLAFNAPHSPLEVPEEELLPYQGQGLNDQTARVYAMVTNIDRNLGRLFAKLDELQLSDDTLVIFLMDNGPGFARYNAGMRGLKGTPYEGGTRVPCLLRLGKKLPAGKRISAPAAHIDLPPTILAACGFSAPANLKIDGVNLWPLCTGTVADLPPRKLFFQWHRGDEPLPFQACSIRSGRYKLVQGKFLPEVTNTQQLPFELFDLEADPAESKNIATEKPDIVKDLQNAYREWFADVSATRGYAPPRMQLGTAHENPMTLTRQDWRGPKAGWNNDAVGYWETEVVGAGHYHITAKFPPAKAARQAKLKAGAWEQIVEVPSDVREITWANVKLPQGAQRIECELQNGKATRGVEYLDILWHP